MWMWRVYKGGRFVTHERLFWIGLEWIGLDLHEKRRLYPQGTGITKAGRQAFYFGMDEILINLPALNNKAVGIDNGFVG